MAKKGWVKDKGKWYYYDTNGSMKKGWVKDKEKWYYLLDNGEMVANRWLQDPKSFKWYFFRSNGEMLVSDSSKHLYKSSFIFLNKPSI